MEMLVGRTEIQVEVSVRKDWEFAGVRILL
jgi:hypothetical protein